MSVIAAGELQRWLTSQSIDRRALIRVSGYLTQPSEERVDILEARGLEVDTVRILLGSPPRHLASPDPGWYSGWSSVFASVGIVQPLVDPELLRELLHDPRRLRFCCDTNALAGGVAAWLLRVFAGRVDVVTSAVVDRELAAWPDRPGLKMWAAKSGEAWSRRTQYRTARRLVECPTPGVVVDRLSPEQSALVLAKLRDESSGKSPDADMLLIELARGLIRDQPANGRVVYLTGDRSHARAATGALGAGNVLFCSADDAAVRRAHGRVRPVGWYAPGGPLGCVLGIQLADVVHAVLTACDVVDLHVDGTARAWRIRSSLRVPNGVPSDWQDPFIDISEIKPSAHSSPVEIVAPSAAVPTDEVVPPNTSAGAGADQLRPDGGAAEPSDAAPSGDVVPPNTNAVAGADQLRPHGGAAVRPRAPRRDPVLISSGRLLQLPAIEAPVGLRPHPEAFFERLWEAMFRLAWPKQAGDVDGECRRILAALGAATIDGQPGPDLDAFGEAWHRNDLDWFHGQLLRLPGYREVADSVSPAEMASSSRRRQAQLSMARRLGQAAKGADGSYHFGDAAVTLHELTGFLEEQLPRSGDRKHVSDLCSAALGALKLTPARLERALMAYWSGGITSGPRIEAQAGGAVERLEPEKVEVLSETGHTSITVDRGALYFGTKIPHRILVRLA